MNENENKQHMEDEVKSFKKQIAPEVFISNIVTIGLFFLSFYDYLPWKIAVNQRQKQLSLKHRYIFTLQLTFIDILPLLICIFVVFNRRRQTYAIDPMDPRGKKFVKRLKGILSNTFEQCVVKIILSFILCTILHSNELILLPTFTFLFVIGRLTFALGYPTHRSFVLY
ncbi:hypothetical protein I4U23_013396 [Adineta vaga]|nr:hypothetical protein I4U23_013396 [Adineta vaga]